MSELQILHNRGDKCLRPAGASLVQNGNPQAPTAYMKRLGKRCGIESLHPHALRHTMASLSIANGADIVSVSQKLGHSEVATTLNIYAHENEEAKEKASQVLADTIYMKRA